ncbi:MAG: secondary thiamine-phosphate synthase enzyme YjbQ [Fervidicoccaceae archaeon]
MTFSVENFSIKLKTSRRIQIIDISKEVEELVAKSKIRKGICLVTAPHATAAIVLNENEPGLLEDLVNFVEKIFPRDAEYRHNLIDSNASSHIASSFIGSSRAIPVENGKLRKGTWQNILFLELDGPRSEREIVVTVMGET